MKVAKPTPTVPPVEAHDDEVVHDVAEAASTAGLHATTGAGASEDWAAQKLVQKRGG